MKFNPNPLNPVDYQHTVSMFAAGFFSDMRGVDGNRVKLNILKIVDLFIRRSPSRNIYLRSRMSFNYSDGLIMPENIYDEQFLIPSEGRVLKYYFPNLGYFLLSIES